MALISQQVEALQKILQRMDAKTIDFQEVDARCKVHNLLYKEQKIILGVLAMSQKNGITPKRITASGLMTKGEIIRTSPKELAIELVECPDLNANITREECLDYSGESSHLDDCKSCKNFNINRDMLLTGENP